MNSIHKVFAAAILTVGTAVSAANAEVIRFENASPTGHIELSNNAYTEAGYTIYTTLAAFVPQNPLPGGAIGDLPYIYGPAATSDFFAICCNTPLSLWRTDGQTFSLNGFDTGISDTQSGVLHVTGLKADSTTVTYDFSFTDVNWHTLSFPQDGQFTDLIKLTITRDGGISTAFDNINVSQVPVPAGLSLFGSALLGLIAARRRR